MSNQQHASGLLHADPTARPIDPLRDAIARSAAALAECERLRGELATRPRSPRPSPPDPDMRAYETEELAAAGFGESTGEECERLRARVAELEGALRRTLYARLVFDLARAEYSLHADNVRELELAREAHNLVDNAARALLDGGGKGDGET